MEQYLGLVCMILLAALGLSEYLGLSKRFESNSLVQAAVKILRRFAVKHAKKEIEKIESEEKQA